MKKTALFIFSLLFATVSFAQNQKDSTDYISTIKSFITDLSDKNKAVDIILSQHIIVENPTDEIYDYLEVSLEEIRINLMTKNVAEIEIIPYDRMNKKDIKDIDTNTLNTDAMYFLYYKKRQMLALYLEGDKIASFTLVSKGNNKAHFVLY